MASSAKIVLFLLLALSVQINAREFFSKFTRVNTDAKETTVANTEQKQETPLPNKQDDQFVTKEEQEPTFLPQTQSGYGLYGHESGQFPSETGPTTTNKVTYAPYVTPIKSGSFENYNPDQAQQNSAAGARFSQNNNNNGYENNVERQGMSDTRFGDARFASTNNNGYKETVAKNDNSFNNANSYQTNEERFGDDTNGNGYKTTVAKNDNSYYNANSFQTNEERFGDDTNANSNSYKTTVAKNENNRYYNGNGNQNNGERQGMSDTRFMENGKYFYDVENENSYYQNQKAARVPLRNEYNYNAKSVGYYGTNVANAGNQMSGQRYENNQDDFEEEFEP